MVDISRNSGIPHQYALRGVVQEGVLINRHPLHCQQTNKHFFFTSSSPLFCIFSLFFLLMERYFGFVYRFCMRTNKTESICISPIGLTGCKNALITRTRISRLVSGRVQQLYFKQTHGKVSTIQS